MVTEGASNSDPSRRPTRPQNRNLRAPYRKRDIPPAPRVEWERWWHWFKGEWKQDEHISIIGPTGTGKSALAAKLLTIRSYTIWVITKPADDKLERHLVGRQHYVKVPAFPKR